MSYHESMISPIFHVTRTNIHSHASGKYEGSKIRYSKDLKSAFGRISDIQEVKLLSYFVWFHSSKFLPSFINISSTGITEPLTDSQYRLRSQKGFLLNSFKSFSTLFFTMIKFTLNAFSFHEIIRIDSEARSSQHRGFRRILSFLPSRVSPCVSSIHKIKRSKHFKNPNRKLIDSVVTPS